jgi:hypothetical protein
MIMSEIYHEYILCRYLNKKSPVLSLQTVSKIIETVFANRQDVFHKSSKRFY